MNLTSAETAAPSVAAPFVPTVQEPAPLAPIVPWWVAAALLGSLAGVSAVIVSLALLVVWLMPRPAIKPVASAAFPEPSAVQPALPVEALKPQEAAGIEADAPMPEPPRSTIKLARRMPSSMEDPAPVQRPMLTKDPAPVAEAPSAPASPQREQGIPKAPIEWAVEAAAPSKRAETNLIVPIEVARIEQGNVLFTLRRLKFPDGEPRPLRLAVTPFVHDDVAGLLKTMGAGYRYTSIRNEDTWSLMTLRNFDVVFLTCAETHFQDFQAALPLRQYVEGGGTLYASDLRGDVLLAAFPEYRGRFALLPGVAQAVEANVIDPGLQAYLGKKTIPLTFDASNWRPAAFDPGKATVCLKGAYRNNLGATWSAPLLVKFRAGKGSVIFTSFHHSKNDGAIVQKLLEYLVFSSVSARSEARVKELMLRSQFAAEDLRPAFVSADRKAEGVCRHAGGVLQIALGFENQGAKLKLTLRSPSGKIVEHEDQGLYLIEIPQAEAGVWQYTVTPIELPYANFPILIAVGKAKNN